MNNKYFGLRRWDGSDANFYDARHWTPYGIPQAGSTAVIREGVVHASNTSLLGITFDIGSDHPFHDPVLSLKNVVFGNIDVFQTPTQDGPHEYPTRYADLNISGFVVAIGSISVGTFDIISSGVPGNLDIRLADGAVLDVEGGLFAATHSLISIQGVGHSVLVHNGITNQIGAEIDIGVPVVGNGTFNVYGGRFSAYSELTIRNFVSPNEHINVNIASLYLTSPREFLGSITELPGGTVTLENIHTTSSSYQNGVLTLFDHGLFSAALHIESYYNLGFDVESGGSSTTIIPRTPFSSHFPQLHDLPQAHDIHS